jgi:hypothetical protein
VSHITDYNLRLTQKVTFSHGLSGKTVCESTYEATEATMRRTIRRTLIVTSTETWTISIENSQLLESLPAEEKPASITDVIVALDDDLPLQPYADREAEDTPAVDTAHSTNEERPD